MNQDDNAATDESTCGQDDICIACGVRIEHAHFHNGPFHQQITHCAPCGFMETFNRRHLVTRPIYRQPHVRPIIDQDGRAVPPPKVIAEMQAQLAEFQERQRSAMRRLR